MAMYGYGYRYPRVARIADYTNPEYRYRWARAAIMNKGIAENSPWIAFLRQRGALKEIEDRLRQLGEEYRALYDVKSKYKTAAQRRKTKIARAIEAVGDPKIHKRLQAEFGDKFKADYASAVIQRLKAELKHLEDIINYKKPTGQVKLSTEEKKGSGYGLLSGLCYGYGEDTGYGHFY
jgi:hypothetical protein